MSTTPVLTGSVAEPLGAAFVAVSGNCAYTLAYFAGTVTVVNISNPAAPVGRRPEPVRGFISERV